MPTICLNMIVKNESKIIKRLLESVTPLVDSYCICDTGSTDDTIQIIETYFRERRIIGKVIREPFRDFGYNRTFALQACLGMINADYLLFLDADMVLQISPNLNIKEFTQSLVHDGYFILQGTESFSYKNMRIVKNQPGQSYWGVTHEYFRPPPNAVLSHVDKAHLFISDIGDGGSKQGKFERDVKLLKKGLEESPDDERYTFYLANTYRDMGEHDNAITYYKKRIAIGGWVQEVWSSYFNIGLCYKLLKDMPTALFYWLEAYEYHQDRIENLYEIVIYYRQQAKHKLAYHYYRLAEYHRQQTKRNGDELFVFDDVYEYKLDYEFTILGHYVAHTENLRLKCMSVLSHPNTPDYICLSILSNYKFYDSVLCYTSTLPTANLEILNGIGSTCSVSNGLCPSTPSLCIDSNGKLIVVKRYVSYKIDDQGNYVNLPNIITKNVVAKINIESITWKITEEFVLDYDTSHDNLYVGLEDIRTLSHNDALYFTANRGLSESHITIEHGVVDMKQRRVQSLFLEWPEDTNKIQKNWVMFSSRREPGPTFIHSWSPLRIGNAVITDAKTSEDPSNAHFNLTHTLPTPTFFKWVRGSTNGITLGDEIWFICHIVSYETRRYYYHLFVVLDKETYAVKKYSPLFTFEKQPVEYTLGFVYFTKTDQLLIGYSVLDRETKFIQIPKAPLDATMVTLG